MTSALRWYLVLLAGTAIAWTWYNGHPVTPMLIATGAYWLGWWVGSRLP